jgi:hypothetical protein
MQEFRKKACARSSGGFPVSFAHHSRIAVAALLLSPFTTTAGASFPDRNDERYGPANIEPIAPASSSSPLSQISPLSPSSPLSQIPFPTSIQTEVDHVLGTEGLSRTAERLGSDTLTTIKNAGGDTFCVLQKAGGDTFATVQKAGDDSIKTTYKAAGDAAATYVKAWRDIGDQGKRSFNDAVDALQAVSHYIANQAEALSFTANNAQKRLRDGKVVDAMWGVETEPLKSSEENFAKATQESKVINEAAASAAAVYGGPAGAAAYAAWSTYRSTGNADAAFRAGIRAAVTSQMGTWEAELPAGTTGEIIKKAAVAGAAGGISVAAAGGDKQAIQDGFLKSAGAVLIQGGSDQLRAYSPKAADAYKTEGRRKSTAKAVIS